MPESRVIELGADEASRRGLASGKLIGGVWELVMPLHGKIGITYSSEPGESLEAAIHKLQKRVDRVLSGRGRRHSRYD